MKYSKFIDHTLLKQDAKLIDIKKLCKEAIEFNFKSVCVNPCYIETCKNELKESDVLVCTVIGFPLGQMTTQAKVFECQDAISKGADEIDMVINISKLKDNDLKYCTDEIKAIKQVCKDKVLKVIIECCLLTDEEKINATNCVCLAGADFVKTSTGFSLSGATFDDVKLLKQTANNRCLVKAAGGVKTHEDFLKMLELGADRIGTSSGTKII